MSVDSLASWMALPEIVCPKIRSSKSKGSVYVVHRIGFLALPASHCGDADLSDLMSDRGKYFFPTAEIESDGGRLLCRLPRQLSAWAFDTVALAHQLGRSPFPMQVEFGVLGGRHYAEML